MAAKATQRAGWVSVVRRRGEAGELGCIGVEYRAGGVAAA
jgi:hypothetical protein